jgi:signal transduction histidine kinase/CheY-like chemotaxis protein
VLLRGYLRPHTLPNGPAAVGAKGAYSLKGNPLLPQDRFRVRRTERLLASGVVLMLVLMVLAALTVVHSIRSADQQRTSLAFTSQVSDSARLLLGMLKDAETGERGFLLSQKDEFLQPYQEAVAQLPAGLQRLQALIAQDPVHTADLASLEASAKAALAEMQASVDMARNQGFAAATSQTRLDKGKETMDAFRRAVADFVQHEAEDAAESRAATDAADRQTLLASLLAGGLVLVSLIVALFLVFRSLHRVDRADRLLREQAALLQVTLDNVRDGVAAFDANQRLIAFNRRFFKLMDFPAQLAAPGRPFADFLDIDRGRPEPAFGELPTAVDDKGPAEGGIVKHLRIGERRLECYLNAMSGGGFIVTCMDITRRLRSEEMLRQSQKMEAIGQLTGGVSHDFNNLLQVITGNLSILAGELSGDERRLKLVNSALLGAERGSRLTGQLLAFARRQPLNPKPLDLGRLIRGMAEMLQRTLGERIQIETIIAGGLWNTLVDQIQLETAILNLAINARDAMPQGGKLTIELSNAFLDDAYARERTDVTPGQYVMLAVTDTGTGMPPDIATRVFEPFFTTKPEGVGTGLGLSMVWGFVKQSAGHVSIYSEPGQGTTVKLYLPREMSAEARADAPTEGPIVGGKETVLLVEDDFHVRQTVGNMLAALGYRVQSAEDVKSALTYLESGARVDLLFTDVVMPGSISSRKLAEQALRMQPQMRVIFTSGYTENAVIHHGRLDPGVHLLSKPFSLDGLARKIRQVFAQPARELPPTPTKVATPASPDRAVLLVEDDLLVRMSTAEMIRELGYRVVEAGTATEAMAALNKHGWFDAVVTDVGLPDGDGHQLAAELGKLRPGLRIIMATGYSDGRKPDQTAQDPAIRYLSKPYELEDLRRVFDSAPGA